jgi:hypothetical protein
MNCRIKNNLKTSIVDDRARSLARRHAYLPVRKSLDEVLGEYPYTIDPRHPHLDDELVATLKLSAYVLTKSFVIDSEF